MNSPILLQPALRSLSQPLLAAGLLLALLALQAAPAQAQGVHLSSGGHVPETHLVREGETLWEISQRYFGDPYQWPRLWSYNPEITNPHWIYPDLLLRLRAAGDASARPASRRQLSIQHAPSGTVWLRDEAFVDEEVLEAAGEIVGAPEEQMLLSPYDNIFVRFEEPENAHPGQSYTIFRVIDEAPVDDLDEGKLVRILGTVRLNDYDRDRDLGNAVITEALDPIERGFQIAMIPRQYEVVRPVVSAETIEAEVIATLRSEHIVGSQQLVFINAGREEGVQLGNRFFVIRSEDEWRSSLSDSPRAYGASSESEIPEAYPIAVVAEARVVHVRSHTSTVMVTAERREIIVGDKLQTRAGF